MAKLSHRIGDVLEKIVKNETLGHFTGTISAFFLPLAVGTLAGITIGAGYGAIPNCDIEQVKECAKVGLYVGASIGATAGIIKSIRYMKS